MNGGFCPVVGDSVCQCPDNYTGDSCEVGIGYVNSTLVMILKNVKNEKEAKLNS